MINIQYPLVASLKWKVKLEVICGVNCCSFVRQLLIH